MVLGRSRAIAILIIILAFLIVSSATNALAQPTPDSTSGAQTDSRTVDFDELGQYALLAPPASDEMGPLGDSLHKLRPLVPFANPRIGTRPMKVWFQWANRPKPFLPTFLILLFASFLITAMIPKWCDAAKAECKARFWKTFFVGLIVCLLGMAAVRIALLTMIGWPLSILISALVQLALLAGMSVIVLAIGQAIGFHLQFDKWIARPDARRLACILIGAAICALMIQIPPIGILPKLGTRLALMLAFVGLGGLYRTRPGQTNSP